MQRHIAGACSSSAQVSAPARRTAHRAASPAAVKALKAHSKSLRFFQQRLDGPRSLTRTFAASTNTTEEVQQAIVAEVDAVAEEQRRKMVERRYQRKREQMIYQVSAIAATAGMGVLAVGATYLRFTWHMREATEFPTLELIATLALVFGGVLGMEMWARWAHKALWHEDAGGWALHKSHHEPRTGPFEANDIFAVVNGVPAMGLCLYGFLTPNILGGLCFGAGLGISLFGIMYMFVHDGLVHRRFPVGPIAELPYLKRVAVAHQLHHSEKYGGVPWGMFLGPQELEALPGGKEELDRMVAALDTKRM